MRDRIFAVAAAIALIPASAGACAMNAPGGSPGSCEVVNAEKLSGDFGDPDAICAAIRQAAAERGLPIDFSVRVEVQSAYLVSAAVTLADGRAIPAVKTASSDRPLSEHSFRMLGEAIATQISKAPR